jgi:hypothetical protein
MGTGRAPKENILQMKKLVPVSKKEGERETEPI